MWKDLVKCYLYLYIYFNYSEKLSAKNIKLLMISMIKYQPNLRSQEFRGLKKFEDSLEMVLETRDNNEAWLHQRADAFIAALRKYI